MQDVCAVTANSISTLQQHGPHLSDKSRVLSVSKADFKLQCRMCRMRSMNSTGLTCAGASQ
jgi:hypothetical protein